MTYRGSGATMAPEIGQDPTRTLHDLSTRSPKYEPKNSSISSKDFARGPRDSPNLSPKNTPGIHQCPLKGLPRFPQGFSKVGPIPKGSLPRLPPGVFKEFARLSKSWPKNSPGLPPGIRKDHTRAVHDFPGNGPRIGPGIGPDPWPSFSTISLRIPEGNRSRLPPRISKILQGLCMHAPSSSPRIPPRNCQGPRGTLHDFRRQSPKCVHKACPRSPKNLVRFPKGFPKTIAQYRLQELTNTPQNP